MRTNLNEITTKTKRNSRTLSLNTNETINPFKSLIIGSKILRRTLIVLNYSTKSTKELQSLESMNSQI